VHRDPIDHTQRESGPRADPRGLLQPGVYRPAAC
jgi:hypothetical protein